MIIREFTQIRKLSYKKVVSWYSGLVKPRPKEPPYGHIIQIGDPTLRTPAEDVPQNLITSPEMTLLINQMSNVFAKYNCVGLSAPQIGISLNIIMFEFNKKHASFYSKEEQRNREMIESPFTVVINPEIRITDYKKITFSESCESVRGLFADVSRFRSLNLKGYNSNGDLIELSTSGWLARIIQHEIDHIQGKIYTDVMNPQSLTCSCWQVINERSGKVELPYGSN